MSEERRPADDTALAMMAHLDLTMAEIGFAPTFEAIGLGERVDVSRLVAGLLLRVSQLCDGFAGGQACAVAEMETLRIPIDEFWAMTRPKDRVEQRLRILVAAALELELVERMLLVSTHPQWRQRPTPPRHGGLSICRRAQSSKN